MDYVFVSNSVHYTTFATLVDACVFPMVGYGTQPRGYFQRNDMMQFMDNLCVDEGVIRITYSDVFGGPRTGSVRCVDAPPEVLAVFDAYSRLRGFVSDAATVP